MLKIVGSLITERIEENILVYTTANHHFAILERCCATTSYRKSIALSVSRARHFAPLARGEVVSETAEFERSLLAVMLSGETTPHVKLVAGYCSCGLYARIAGHGGEIAEFTGSEVVDDNAIAGLAVDIATDDIAFSHSAAEATVVHGEGESTYNGHFRLVALGG